MKKNDMNIREETETVSYPYSRSSNFKEAKPPSDSPSDLRLAIDLGAMKCCAAAATASNPSGNVVIIPTATGGRSSPAFVTFTRTGRLIGEAARKQRFIHADTTITNIKRLCGRSFTDPIISQDLALFPTVVCGENNRPEFVFNVNAEETCNCYPELLLSMLLDDMKQRAENFLNNRRLLAILTVPPSLDNAQRAAIMDAASVANLPVNRLLSDPLAAASAFRHHELDGILKDRTNFILLVIDVGACTSDVSVVRLHPRADGKDTRLGEVSLLSSVGSSTLGGIDFDRGMCNVLLRQLKKSVRKELRGSKAAMRRLMVTSEQLKCTLSACKQANVELAGLHGDIGLFAVIRREQFEEACEPLFEEITGFVESALAEASMEPDDIDEVLLLGGSQRIPKLRKMIEAIFSYRDLYTSLSNDEALACGTAVAQDLHFNDLVGCTYGVRQPSGLLLPLVRRREPLPARVTKPFATMEENQESMTIEIYEGERAFSHQNRLACRISTLGIPPGAKGARGVQVTLKVDLNGILSVMASARGDSSQASYTGYQQQGQVAGSVSNVEMMRRITQEDVRKMTFQSEHLKMDDELQRMLLESRDELEALATTIATTLRTPDTVESFTKKEILTMETTCQNALTWLEKHPTATLDDIDKQMVSLRGTCDVLSNNQI